MERDEPLPEPAQQSEGHNSDDIFQNNPGSSRYSGFHCACQCVGLIVSVAEAFLSADCLHLPSELLSFATCMVSRQFLTGAGRAH